MEANPLAAPLGGVEVGVDAVEGVVRVMTVEVVRVRVEDPLVSVMVELNDSVVVTDDKDAELVTDPVWVTLLVPVEVWVAGVEVTPPSIWN